MGSEGEGAKRDGENVGDSGPEAKRRNAVEEVPSDEEWEDVGAGGGGGAAAAAGADDGGFDASLLDGDFGEGLGAYVPEDDPG